MSAKPRIQLSRGYHAEPGDTTAHHHDVYVESIWGQGEQPRQWVGQLTSGAVESWRKAEEGRVEALGKLMGARTRVSSF